MREGASPMSAPLPALLEDNPELDQWVAFPAPGKVTVLTGRVEIGQGVLTAMRADRRRRTRCVAWRASPCAPATRSDAERGLHRRQPVDPVRRRRACGRPAPRCARCSSPRPRACSAARGRAVGPRRRILAQRRGDRPGLLVAGRRGRSDRQGDRHRRAQSASPISRASAESSARSTCRPRCSASRLYSRHEARRHGACARRAPAAPRRDDRHDRRGRDPPRRQRAGRDRARRQLSRHPRRRRDRGRSRAAVARQSRRPGRTSRRRRRRSRRRAGCCSSPSIDRVVGAPMPANPQGRERYEATYSRGTSPTPRSRRPAGSRSTGTAS